MSDIDYKIISADTHIVEPREVYESRLPKKFSDRAPKLVRFETDDGRPYDAWMLDGARVGTSLGNFIQAGRRFEEDLDKIDFIGTWDDVPEAAFEPNAMLEALEQDGIWGAVVQSGQGVFWYRIQDSEMLSALFEAHNTWLAEFCSDHLARLRGVACLNVDDVNVACAELKRCAELGHAAAMIPVSPLPDRPYSHPIYEKLWWSAQDLEMPLILHITTPRGNIPGNETSSFDNTEWTSATRSTMDHWVRHSLTSIIFSGAFDRYPNLRVGSAEHEGGWVPHWLNQMDWVYTERPNVYADKGWRSRHGLPSEVWRRNMFLVFEEDGLAIQLRDIIGVDNMMWGNDFSHAESTWPESQRFLDEIFEGVPAEDRKKITSTNAARLFGFDLN